MDEYIDILNDKGEITGLPCLKSEAHKKGLFHASVHIWIFDKLKNILIQKRIHSKDVFPNLWDISVAGHIAAGEKPINAAQREIEEEIGLNIPIEQIHFIGTFKKKVEHNIHLIDNELHYIYVCEKKITLNLLKIQKEEVAAVQLMHINKLKNLVTHKNNNFVPHGKNYFQLVFNKIQNYSKV